MVYVGVSNPSDRVAASQPSTSPQSPGATSLMSARRLAANRRNALKSTGPRTKAGKFRSALNRQTRRLVPQALERELRARGEDPREFCKLHRDLAAIFHPNDLPVSAAVMMLACAWWQKARRIRQWVGAGVANCPELDTRIEALLILVIDQMRAHRKPWLRRLADAVGSPVGRPAEVRRQIEDQLELFGGKSRARRYRPESKPAAESRAGIEGSKETLEAYLERELRAIMAENASRTGASKPNQTH